jgi:hypothetical protein
LALTKFAENEPLHAPDVNLLAMPSTANYMMVLELSDYKSNTFSSPYINLKAPGNSQRREFVALRVLTPTRQRIVLIQAIGLFAIANLPFPHQDFSPSLVDFDFHLEPPTTAYKPLQASAVLPESSRHYQF